MRLISVKMAISLVAILTMGLVAAAQDSQPLSRSDFEKLAKLIDRVGTSDNFPAPIGFNLWLTQDRNRELPVVDIVTPDLKIYFCRSLLNATDYIVWVIGDDEKSSKMFVTGPDVRLVRALYMRADAVPQSQDVNDPATQADYKSALASLARDLPKMQEKKAN